MNRRDVLRAGGVAGVGLLAGCIDRYRDATDAAAPVDGTTGTTTDATAGTTEGRPTLRNHSFEVLDSGCGTVGGDASLAFDRDAATLTVEGTISGSDSCAVARIASARYEDGAFTVMVETTRQASEGTACADCITEIRYRATFAFEGALPSSVAVVHDGQAGRRTVATATPETTTA
ncbi:hypothetical protein [Halomicrococcus gelatinilyticus]|uniref:hypothetical protein n=1 Tax=Halomicrococcus gelatinilyticus TaxID=1702103 RepID=UPI002E0F3466